ncbi:hypothetical protein GLOTRDRAFT_93422 [Gloeophyllum trabeum ATCC 11539]|uniref:Uncharacterized protein n=1 Tax=Gloeophyllum trabeum (strain ATCC 11539 / FP-39264 / Madison 617) TaxID=670483 RepID=S7RN54_GLOTA|nr:uncharacterized protein GLOTRDRAFT_93422 [Gloeophyllum trabeum ATCC 11539]EPQ55895.1 hypothetical protein GLOTRDRAFT_93422 [Gloeophyllum trabeum ATCC 11539]
MSQTQSVAVVDLKTRAVQLATELSSREHFWHAAKELLTFKSLSSSDFVRHSRKISRTRLTESHIPLSKHVVCTPGHEPYRAIYIDLLEALQTKQYLIDDVRLRGWFSSLSLETRVKQLLVPLTSTSTASGSIKVTGGSAEDHMPSEQSNRSNSHYHPYDRPGNQAFRAHSGIPKRDTSMPPPDELPLVSKKPKINDRKPFHDPWLIFDEDQTDHDSPEILESLGTPSLVPQRGRIRGKFGIFCTKKTR